MTSVAPPENLLPISQFASRKDPRSDDEILNTTPLLSIHDAMITAAKSHRARESPSAGLMRPDPLHIPGSYRSEVSDQTIQETAEEAGLAEHKSAPDDPPHIETLEADEYDGNINVSGQEEPEVAHNAQHSPLAIHRNPDISSFHSRLDTPEQLEWEVEHEHSSVKPNVMLPAIKSSGLDAAATSPEALEWLHDHATSTAPPERSRVSPSLSSFRSQKGPVSLASGTSRTAAYRHALLKPRVGSTGPLDMGLPIQPLLTTKDELGGISAVDDKRHNSLPASKKIALSDLAIAANAPTALERLKEQAVQNTGYDTRLPSRRRESSVKGVRPKNALLARKSEQETPEVSNAEEPLRDDQGYTNDLPPSKLTADQAAYWGISPLIRGAVQSAVHDGVRKAVREIKLVTGIQHDTTTGVYERLIADSLAEASNEAEDHLRRNSIWDRLSSPSVDKLSSSHTQTSLITNHSSENATISTSVVYRRNGRQVDSGVPKRATTTTNLPLAEHKLSDVAGSSIEQASLSEKPKPVQEAVKLDSIAAPAMQPQTEPKVTETVPFIDRNKTLLWLKDLLTHSTEPNRPDFEAGKVPGRSQPEAAEPPEEEIVKIERTLSDSKIMKRTPARTQTFTKTIEDLEVLLNEAVSIANDATALEGVNALPALFANASTVSKSHGYSEDVPVYTGSGTRSNTIRQSRADTKSRSTDHVSMHESMRDSSDDSSSASDANLVTGTHEDHSMIDTSALSIGEEGEDGRSKIRTWPVIRFKDPLPSPGLLRAMTSHAPMAGYDTAESPIPLKSTLNDSKIVSSDQTPETLAPSRGDMDQYDSKTNVPPPTKLTIASKQPYIEDTPAHISQSKPINLLPNKREVREYIRVFHHPPIQVRDSSKGRADRVTGTRPAPDNAQSTALDCATAPRDADCSTINSIRSLDRESGDSVLMDFSTPQGFRKHAGVRRRTEAKDTTGNGIELQDIQSGDHKIPDRHASGRALLSKSHQYLSLRGKHHVDIGHHKGFSLSHSHKRQPIARDWSSARKRFTAAIACISTSLVGILVGIYAGEVPSIQYYIADFHHYAILGNVFFYIGLAIPTFLAWPLPLMHGRKPYILSSMTIAMPLLFPQAIAVQVQRSPYTDAYRVCLILPRAFMGLALGLAQMNFMAILLDLFGASLMSSNPHQEVVDRYDVRRHGGGFGLWLGIWTWSYVGSIGFGFWIGAWIINSQSPDWGFYVSIIIIAVVLLLNVLAPEVRRSVYRRSVAEVREGADIKRRLARGEVMMHRVQTGPKWWGQELQHGVLLSLDMLRQPGFLVLAFYTAWTYAQIILLIVVSSRATVWSWTKLFSYSGHSHPSTIDSLLHLLALRPYAYRLELYWLCHSLMPRCSVALAIIRSVQTV